MKKILIVLLLILGLACTLFGVTACNGNGGTGDGSYVEDGEIIVGGDDLGTQEGKKTILNANDVHVGISATANGVSSEAYVLDGITKLYTEIDLSAVTFGTAGVYDIKYVYGSEEVAKKLYIYGAPTITGENAISVPYSLATTDIFNGLTAKDSFGGDLDCQVFEASDSVYGEMIDADGSFNIGTFSAKIIAVDKAGQVASFDRAVTITEEQNPTVEANYSFDVTDESVSFELSDEDASMFVGISVDGKIVSAEYVTIEKVDGNNVYTISKNFFYDNVLNKSLVNDLVNGDDYVFTVLTVKGKAKVEMTVTDNQPILFNTNDIDVFISEPYSCFTSIKVPKIYLANKYQKVTPVYTMIQGDRNEFDNNFTFNKDGEWTLEIDLRGQKVNKTVRAYYDLGLENGTIYGGDNLFTAQLPEGYTLKEYSVSTFGNSNAKILSCTDASSINAFIDGVHGLNTKNVYEMNVIAEKGGEIYTQSAMFGVVKNGVGVFATKANSNDMYVNNETYTSLAYTQKTVGGRAGVYEWKALVANSSGSDKTLIAFSPDMKANIQKDYYLTFDIYYQKGFTPVVMLGGKAIFFWDIYLSFDSIDDCMAAEPHRNPKDMVECFGASYVRMFNEDGSEILDDPSTTTRDRSIFLSATKLNQWITVQVKVGGDDLNKNYGIYTYSQALDTNGVYLSNIRVSENSLMEDTTVNPSIQDNSGADFGDIWNR